MKKALIISYSFPPYNDIAAMRYGSMVKYMKECGWQPWVLTTNSEGLLALEIDEQYVIRIGHRCKINDIKTEISSDGKLPFVFYLIRKFTNKINFRFKMLDRSLLNWYVDVKKHLKQINNVDIIIASYGPPAALWLGKHFAKTNSIPWIADMRDLGALKPDNRNKFAVWIDQKIEKYLFLTVTGFITVSNGLNDILSQEYKKDVKTIYNGWDNSELKSNGDLKMSENKYFSYIYYAGRFYVHQLNSLKLLLEVLANPVNNNLNLILRSLGPKKIENEIVDIIKKNKIEDRVQILKPCSQEIVENEQMGAIANLVLEDLSSTDIFSKGTLTGKFLQLIIKNPAVLAIARHDSEIGDILISTSKGKLCSTSKDIEYFLKEITNKSNNYMAIKEEVEKYSKKNQAAQLCLFLNDQLS